MTVGGQHNPVNLSTFTLLVTADLSVSGVDGSQEIIEELVECCREAW
jgi:predicted component of type VI protein secretion system